MAYALRWSPVSVEDLREVVRFIAQDSADRAGSFAVRLMAQADRLQDFPEIGRVVPELGDPTVRELIFRPYRIVYRVSRERQRVEIVRVWHSARGVPAV